MELGGSDTMNNVTLVGYLSTDVFLRETQTGQKTAWFKVATDRRGENAGADFIPVKAWNGTAEACAKYLHGPDKENGVKASRVAIEGSVRTNRREKDGGGYEDFFEISARSVQFLDPKPTGDSRPDVVAPSTPEPTEAAAPSDDDIPF